MKGSDYNRVAEAIRFLSARAVEQPSLADIALHLGMSDYHFHRMFKRWAGITPKDFLQALTLANAKKLLAQSNSVLQTSVSVGLSGTSRLHDLFITFEAMTPGQYKEGGAGLVIRWGIHPTPFGDAIFAATDRGLCGLEFVDSKAFAAVKNLQARWPHARLKKSAAKVEAFAQEVSARMRGQTGKPLVLAPNGSPLQVKVWNALLSVSEGQRVTYGQVATILGMPGAARAIGSAIASNPIGYLIPCHRVIRATGAIGEYHWGAERKVAMLAVETSRMPR